MTLDYFSYSSLQSYQKCPAQFHFRYIKRIFKNDEGIEAFMGKRVHETIEYIYIKKNREEIYILIKLLNIIIHNGKINGIAV